MKKISLLALILITILSFALVDTDSDGVDDAKDICPRVYARSETGCPKLAEPSKITLNNACLEAHLNEGFMIATFVPICTNNACPTVSKIVGYQACDPIFPVIFDTTGNVLIRGSVYIIDFSQ